MKKLSTTSGPEVVLYMRTAFGGPGAPLRQNIDLFMALQTTPVRLRGAYADLNVSGNARRRPELDRMPRDIHRTPVDYVMVDGLDRLGRNALLQTDVRREIEASGTRLIADQDDLWALRSRCM